MYRFRKRSDAKSVDFHPEPLPASYYSNEQPAEPHLLQTLPPASDFRTSLILPDLSRRFTILRDSTGDALAIDAVKTKLAERRANGVQDTITEEEEDMLISALSRMRHARGNTAQDVNDGTGSTKEADAASLAPYSPSDLGSLRSNIRNSAQSSGAFSVSSGNATHIDPKHASMTSSRSSKRHSNNLFASGHFRDVKVMRKPGSRVESTRSVSSSTPSEVSNGIAASTSTDTERPRPSTPDQSGSVIGEPSSPDSVGDGVRQSHSPSSPSGMHISSMAIQPLRFTKRLTESQVKRMSVSLEDVIRELEEEAEDQVLVPRSSTSSHPNGSDPSSNPQTQKINASTFGDDVRANVINVPLGINANDMQDRDDRSTPRAISDTSGDFGASNGSWAVSEDRNMDTRSPSPYQTMGSASPVPRVPGYIPGMPRPMTPRQLDLDDQRSHSTTPRATAQPFASHPSSTLLLRRGSNASTSNNDARPTSPLTPLLYRSPTGRATPEERHKNVFDHGIHSPNSTYSWKRPSSPLSSPSSTSAFQSMPNGSRPSTPSNSTGATAIMPKPLMSSTRTLGRNGTLLAHGRNLSSVSFSDAQDSGETTATEGTRSTIRAVRSPTRVGSPAVKNTKPNETNYRSTNAGPSPTTTAAPSDYNLSSNINRLRSPSPMHDINRSVNTPSPSDQDAVRLYQKSPVSLITPPVSPFSARHQNPLHFSTVNNSSRTSLVSAGSSYHSWNEGITQESGFIGDLENRELAWHEFPDTTDTSVSSDQKYLVPDEPETILRQFTGLSKMDITAIQHKLVEATHTKYKVTETRSPSTLRRRRPSTAQSMHSFGGGPSRTTSPAPQGQATAPYSTPESAAKASALLASVMDSIQHLTTNGIEPSKDEPAASSSFTHEQEQEPHLDPDPELEQEDIEDVVIPDLSALRALKADSPSRRNKDLTDMLFGEGDHSLSFSPSPPLQSPNETSEAEMGGDGTQETPVASPTEAAIPPAELTPVTTPEEEQRKSSIIPSHSPSNDIDLVKQIQEKADAAMAQLRRSPQQPRFNSPTLPASRKRINTNDISSPRLVQSSTSVEKFPSLPSTSPSALPLQSPLQRQPPSKLSFGIKRLRNTLKGKNSTLTGDEISPWTVDNASSSYLHTSRSAAVSHSSPRASPIAPSSTTDLQGYRPTGHSPPGSASGLKGFMSLFRKKSQQEHHNDSTMRNASPSAHMYMASTSSFVHVDKAHLMPPQSAPPLQNRTFMDKPEPSVQTFEKESTIPSESTIAVVQDRPFISHAPSRSDPHALSRFYEAATTLGLDRAALNDFLTKSQSQPIPAVDSTPSITVHVSPADALSVGRNDRQNGSSSSSDQTLFPSPDGGLMDKPSIVSRTSLSPEPSAPARLRQPAEGHTNVNNSVVRRTIIFPSANGSNTDLSSLVRKASKSRRRASGTSLQSNRSVHDRAPTPPPSRAKRQSVDSSPPVPSLPGARTWFSQGGLLQPRSSHEVHTTEKTTSMYESLYEMYAGDRGQHGMDASDIPRSPTSESVREGEGQAIEVIELANGETIWSIVNGLRADDAESVYPHRSSFQSEFSTGPHETEGEQLFFKEHARTGSKGSNRSGLFRRKTTGATRPETKVFYSSSTQIARLIEQLSRGADAGSFNIMKQSRPGHSHSGSLQSEPDMHWTVEERLEKLPSTGTAN